jgi:hypothetical protein
MISDLATIAGLPRPLGLVHHDSGPVAVAIRVVIGTRLIDIAGVRHRVYRKGCATAVLVDVVLGDAALAVAVRRTGARAGGIRALP